MLIVMDTNVLVSALITPFGNAARILEWYTYKKIRIMDPDEFLKFWQKERK